MLNLRGFNRFGGLAELRKRQESRCPFCPSPTGSRYADKSETRGRFDQWRSECTIKTCAYARDTNFTAAQNWTWTMLKMYK